MFSSYQAAALADISYRQLDYWCRTGTLRPSVADAWGSGSRRVFTAEDVTLLRLCGRLAALGADTDVLTEVVASMRGLPADLWDGLLVVHHDGHVQLGGTVRTAAWVVELGTCPLQSPADLAHAV